MEDPIEEKPPVEMTEDVKEVPDTMPGPNADASLIGATEQPTVISTEDPAVDYSEQGLIDAKQADIDQAKEDADLLAEPGPEGESVFDKVERMVEQFPAEAASKFRRFAESLEEDLGIKAHPKVLVHGSHNAAMTGLQTDQSGNYKVPAVAADVAPDLA